MWAEILRDSLKLKSWSEWKPLSTLCNMFSANKRAGILGGRKTHQFLHFCNLIGFCLHTLHTLQQCLLYFDNNWQQSIKQAWFPQYVGQTFPKFFRRVTFYIRQSIHAPVRPAVPWQCAACCAGRCRPRGCRPPVAPSPGPPPSPSLHLLKISSEKKHC